MKHFKDWIVARESSSHTRARAAAANGLMPLATVGSINGGSTASPSIQKSLTKKFSKKKKKKHGKKKKPLKNNQVDSWLKEVEKLKSTIDQLKVALSKKTLTSSKKEDKLSSQEKKKDEKKQRGD